MANIINVTRYPEKFLNGLAGYRYSVPPSGTLINGILERTHAPNHKSGAAISYAGWVPCPDEEKALSRIEEKNPGAIIIGGLGAAMAYPGRILLPIPVPGFEDGPPQQRIMQHMHFSLPTHVSCACSCDCKRSE